MKKLSKIKLISFVVALIFFIFFTLFVTNPLFTKDITTYEEHIEKEKIETFVCYTTATGKCYHNERCQYLNKSKYQTNVYEAELDGYLACSKCTPREETVIELEKTISTPKTVSETNTAASLLTSITVSVIFYFLLTLKPRLEHNKLNKS